MAKLYYKSKLTGTNTSAVHYLGPGPKLALDEALQALNESADGKWLYSEITAEEYHARKDEPYPWKVTMEVIDRRQVLHFSLKN